MLPFGIGFGEVLLIGVVVLLVVGPHKLPELARTLGKGLRVVRKAGQELRNAMDLDEIREVRRELYKPLTEWRHGEPEDVVPEDVEPERAESAAPVPPGHTPTVGAKAPAAHVADATTANAPLAAAPVAEPPAESPDVGSPVESPDVGSPAESPEPADEGPVSVARHDPFYHRLKAEVARLNDPAAPSEGDDGPA